MCDGAVATSVGQDGVVLVQHWGILVGYNTGQCCQYDIKQLQHLPKQIYEHKHNNAFTI